MNAFMLRIEWRHTTTSKYPKRIMVWLIASKNGFMSSIIFKPGETLSHENYIDVVLPHAQI